VGKRWTGAIIMVLMQRGPARFSEVGAAVPELSDRLLSERMKELEARGLVERRYENGRARYRLTPMGEELRPAVAELQSWAQRWL
jgi:DNA-binding HxlR family transcriptional regulator